MLGKFKRLLTLLIPGLACTIIFVGTSSAQAPGNVTISSVIAPVHYILIDNHDKIIEILSNSPTNIKPVVYRNRFDTTPVKLTQSVYSQYAKIMARVNTHNTGTIYKWKAPPQKSIDAARWIRELST